MNQKQAAKLIDVLEELTSEMKQIRRILYTGVVQNGCKGACNGECKCHGECDDGK